MRAIPILFSCVWLLHVFATAGCSSAKPDPFQLAVVASLASATMAEVWEGLPHPHWEPDRLKAELAQAKTIELHGHPFYDAPQPLASAQRDEFVAMLAKPDAVTRPPAGAQKACGGFHPDYALVWSEGEQHYAIFCCFGCNEVKLFSADSEQSYDVSPRTQFEAILKPFHQQRPEFQPRR